MDMRMNTRWVYGRGRHTPQEDSVLVGLGCVTNDVGSQVCLYKAADMGCKAADMVEGD